ncbi:CD209 antigen-like protein A [Cheilinus undulatus]|uniref:CD209 antigen-like protein A n=1 Tax=Cheilinus undulatus TaxID=241271 RepID=UPI001BD4C9F0|nr:CD209 antigen-like protein A [Cheilinus undulatus]
MASFHKTEEIYVNAEDIKPVDIRPPTIQTSPGSSHGRFYRPVVLFLGLLSIILLAGIIGLGVLYLVSAHHASVELSTIKANLTVQLQVKDQQLSTLTEQRDLLNVSLTNIRKNLMSLSKQMKTCPAGWKMFQCSCYFFSTHKNTWNECRKDCQDKDADLVIINSPEEEEFLTNNIKGSTWIGLSDQEKEGTWKWTDGTQLTMAYWWRGQPDNGGGNPQYGEEDCCHFATYKKEAKWNDLRCDTPLLWVCEK